MKKQKQTDENPEVKEGCENCETTQTETTDAAAEQIVDEMELMAQKCAELNDKNLRLMAEFDNYRKTFAMIEDRIKRLIVKIKKRELTFN